MIWYTLSKVWFWYTIKYTVDNSLIQYILAVLILILNMRKKSIMFHENIIRRRLLITGIRFAPATRAVKWCGERIQDELRDWRINRQIKRGNSPGGDRTKEKRQGGCRWVGGLSAEGWRVRWREGGKLSLRAARQYFHFALIVLFSFSSISLSSLALPVPLQPAVLPKSPHCLAFALLLVPIGTHCTPNENLSIAMPCRRI